MTPSVGYGKLQIIICQHTIMNSDKRLNAAASQGAINARFFYPVPAFYAALHRLPILTSPRETGGAVGLIFVIPFTRLFQAIDLIQLRLGRP